MTFQLKSKESKTILYADDTVVSNKGSTETVGKIHDATLASVANWFHKNKLTIKNYCSDPTCGGRNYILKWIFFFCSVNFGRSIYSS